VAGCCERRNESLTPGANDDDQRVASPDGYYASRLVNADGSTLTLDEAQAEVALTA
jgi:hypothetical protein